MKQEIEKHIYAVVTAIDENEGSVEKLILAKTYSGKPENYFPPEGYTDIEYSGKVTLVIEQQHMKKDMYYPSCDFTYRTHDMNDFPHK